MSEIAKVFQGLPKRFQKGAVKTPRTFYFSLGDDEKWTVALSGDKCQVTEGKPDKDADCFFKASKEMFLDVWNGKRLATLARPPRALFGDSSCGTCGSHSACNARGRCYVSALQNAGTLHAPDAFCTQPAP